MKKNHFFTAIVLGLAFICMTISRADAKQEVWTLKYWVPWAPTWAQAQVEKRFVESVEKATGGRVIIKPYWSESLMSNNEAYMGLVDGVFEIGHFGTSTYPGLFPVSDIPSLPFMFEDSDQAYKVMTGLHEKGMMPEFDKIKLASFRMTDMMMLVFGKKQVKSLEDIKGMKLRVMGSIASDSISALGAVPVGIKTPDLFMSMERGVIDGLVSSPGFMANVKIWEVADYALDHPLWLGTMFVGVNKKTWNSLPDDIKAILEKEFEKQALDFNNQEVTQGRKNKGIMEKNGMKFYKLSSEEFARWKNSVRPIESSLIKKLDKAGLDGKKILDAAKSAAGKY